MDQFFYRDILDEKMVHLCLTFQQGNNPKHNFKLIKQGFETNQIEVMKWPTQLPDFAVFSD